MVEPFHALIVDDEEGIRFSLTEILSRQGYIVTTAASGEEALEHLRETAFDVAILDLRLGGRVDGIRILEAVNWRWPEMAKIILTGHGSLDTAMAAIREGVDAYLLKPVKARDLRQVLSNLVECREKPPKSSSVEEDDAILKRGPFVVDRTSHQVTMNEKPLELTSCEFKLLVYLMENDDRVVPPPKLVQVVRQYEPDHLQEARDIIKWYIYRLRRKVEPSPACPRFILNVRGVGYTFKG
ncbi:MAG: response regulator transcription factor [Anaerolineae bacterium]